MSQRVFVGLAFSVLLGCVVLVSGCSKANPTVVPKINESVATTVLPLKHFAAGRAFDDGPVDLCLILSGEMYGYLQPCGCSRPQVGGLERRYELMRRFSSHGYALSAADLGDLSPKNETGPQSRWKFETSVKALKTMSYAAISLGPTDFALQLNNVLDLAQNYQPPYVLAANLLDAEGQFPEMFRGWTIDDPRREDDALSLLGRIHQLVTTPLSAPAAVIGTLPITGRPRIGYFALVGDSVVQTAKQRNPTLKFANALETFSSAIKPFLDAKPALRVLLFQGTSEEAKQFLKAHPKTFQIVLCQSDADVAPLLPIKDDGGAWIIMVGHRGKAVGVVAYRQGQPLRYRLEELVEELELPDNKTNPTREVMKEYVWGVYRNNYLKDVSKISHPLQLQESWQNAEFVGSAKCVACHATAHATWSNSQHSHAWETLVKYGRPIAEVPQKDMNPKLIGRQFDPDCVSCHVTGFGYKGGFIDQEKTPYLFGNSCENCHGPGSLHLNQPTNPSFSNPLHLDITAKETENKCRKCHDLDNDPHFDMKKWDKIKHGREGQVPRSAP